MLALRLFLAPTEALEEGMLSVRASVCASVCAWYYAPEHSKWVSAELQCLLVWLIACLPACLLACLLTCLPLCLPAYLHACLPACLLTHLEFLECCRNSFRYQIPTSRAPDRAKNVSRTLISQSWSWVQQKEWFLPDDKAWEGLI